MPRKKREPLPEVGARIREARIALGISQQDLANRIMKTASALSKYEAGQVSEVPVLVKLAEALGRSTDWLLYGDRGHSEDAEVRSPSMQDPMLRLGVPPKRVRLLPTRYRNRYARRAKEVIDRAQRELAEYTEVLEAEFQTDRATQTRSK